MDVKGLQYMDHH